MSASQLVSIVVPTYQEAPNIVSLVGRVASAMLGMGRRWEMIIVDDDSRDGTDAIVADLAASGEPVRLVTRRGERGLSSAVIAGFRQAGGQVLVCMDADLSHPPEALPAMLALIDSGQSDFVVGSRYVAGGSTEASWSLARRLNSQAATLLARPFARLNDPMSGFFALPREVFLQAVDLSPIGYKIGLEVIVKCGCRRIMEVPIHFADRKAGQSKLSIKEQLNYVRHLVRLAKFKLFYRRPQAQDTTPRGARANDAPQSRSGTKP